MVVNSESRSLLEVVESMENTDELIDRDVSEQQHCHFLLLHTREDKSAERALRIISVLSAIFIVTEFTGGVLSNSLSIITDAGHMLSDFFSFLISLAMIRMTRVSPTRKLTFGFLRAEVLGALISIFIVWILTIVLIIFATQRVMSGQIVVEPDTMLVTALMGVFFNVIMASVLTCSSGHVAHSHGCHDASRDDKHRNVNVRAAFIHVLGDFVQSIGVLTAAVIIKLTNWTMADPLCTYMFSIIVLCTSIPVFRDICLILLEGFIRLWKILLATPQCVNYIDVYDDLLCLDGVKHVHSLHIWSLNSSHTCASAHLVIDDDLAFTSGTSAHLASNTSLSTSVTVSPLLSSTVASAITKKALNVLQNKHHIAHTTIQLELMAEHRDLNEFCEFCRPLP